MHIVFIAWIYVVVLMSVIEAASNQGSLLGAFTTLLLYGVFPLGMLIYFTTRSARRRAAQQHEPPSSAQASGELVAPDRGKHAAGDGVAPKREEA